MVGVLANATGALSEMDAVRAVRWHRGTSRFGKQFIALRSSVSQMLVKDICETVKPSENGASKPSSTNIKRFAIGLDFSRPSDLGEKHPCGMLSRRPTRQRRACDHSNRTALDERRVILGGLVVRAVVGRKMEMCGKWMNRGLVV